VFVGAAFRPEVDLGWDALRETTILYGHVTRVEPTGERRSGQVVDAVEFRYPRSDGAPEDQTGRSYAVGGAVPGAQVFVRVPVAHPERACIEDMHRRPYGRDLALLAFVPAALLGLLLWALAASGRRNLELLVTGRIAVARLVGHTRIPLSKPPHYQLEYAFDDHAGRRQRKTLVTGEPEHYGDGPQTIVYDQGEPARRFLLASLPGAPQLDARGESLGDVTTATWFFALALPVLVPIGSIVVVVARLLS
jgi:hypothetical protein